MDRLTHHKALLCKVLQLAEAGIFAITFQSFEKVQSCQAGALLREYQKLLSSGQLKPDPNQEQCLHQLSKLADSLPAHTRAVKEFQDHLQRYQVHSCRPCAGSGMPSRLSDKS